MKRSMLTLLPCLVLAGFVFSAEAKTWSFAPDAVCRIIGRADVRSQHDQSLFSTFNSVGDPTNNQHTLLHTPNASFMNQLNIQLGPLAAGEIYVIHEVSLIVGHPLDDYTQIVQPRSILRDWDPATVTWNTFNNGGTAGVDYTASSAATDTRLIDDGATAYALQWELTDQVNAWLNGQTNRGLFFPVGASDAPGTYTLPEYVRWQVTAEKTQPIPAPLAVVVALALPLFVKRNPR